MAKERACRVSFYLKQHKTVVWWYICINLPYQTLHVLRCHYCACQHCNIDAETIYCAALILSPHSLVSDGRDLEITELVTEQQVGSWWDGWIKCRQQTHKQQTSKQHREVTRRARSGHKHAKLIHTGWKPILKESHFTLRTPCGNK